MKGVRGTVRKLDDLGRVVIPKEYRDFLELEESQELEIILKNDEVVIRKNKDTFCPQCLTRCNHTDRFCRNCGMEFGKIKEK